MRNNSAVMGVVGGTRITVGSTPVNGGGSGGTVPVGVQMAPPTIEYASQYIYQVIAQPELATQRWTYSPSGQLALNYYNLHEGTAPDSVPSVESCHQLSTSGIWVRDFYADGWWKYSSQHQATTSGSIRNTNARYMWFLVRGVVYDSGGGNASNVVERQYKFIHSYRS